jgi:hypothetical protein
MHEDIFNARRDGGTGVFIYSTNASYNDLNLAGPTIGSNIPTNTPGGIYAPYMIGRFVQIASNALTIYYTMSTWNPYTIVLMKSDFTIIPQIDPGTLVATKTNFCFAWSAPTNGSYQVDYATNRWLIGRLLRTSSPRPMATLILPTTDQIAAASEKPNFTGCEFRRDRQCRKTAFVFRRKKNRLNKDHAQSARGIKSAPSKGQSQAAKMGGAAANDDETGGENH